MALEPGVWGESFYGLGAVAIMGTLVASTLYVSHILVVRGARRLALRVACHRSGGAPSPDAAAAEPCRGVLVVQLRGLLHLLPCALLVMAALVIRILLGRTRRGALSRLGMVARAAVSPLLAFVVAGGNFVTALVGVLALAGATVAGVLHPQPPWPCARASALGACGRFAASLAAPGNAVGRQRNFPPDALGPVATIAKSACSRAGSSLCFGRNGLLVLMLALVLPLLARAAARSRWSFRLPGLVLAGAFALFMASLPQRSIPWDRWGRAVCRTSLTTSLCFWYLGVRITLPAGAPVAGRRFPRCSVGGRGGASCRRVIRRARGGSLHWGPFLRCA